MKKVFFYSTLVSFLSLHSCTDENSPIGNNVVVKPRTCVGLSSGEVDSVGANHNAYLDVILPYYSAAEDNWEDEIADAVAQAGDDLGFSQAVIDQAIEDMDNEFDISNHTTDFDDYSAVEGYYYDISDLIDNLSGAVDIDNYTDFKSDLAIIVSAASIELECFDLAFIEACASVAGNSALYWLPTAEGGEGNEMPGGMILAASRWWKSVIWGDVTGLATAFMAYGVGLAVPGTNVAIAGALAYSAASSSAFAAAAASKGIFVN